MSWVCAIHNLINKTSVNENENIPIIQRNTRRKKQKTNNESKSAPKNAVRMRHRLTENENPNEMAMKRQSNRTLMEEISRSTLNNDWN